MSRPLVTGALALLAAATALAVAGADDVRALLAAGDYEGAAQALAADPTLAASAEGRLLGARLADTPAQALPMLADARGSASAEVAVAAALDAAGISLGAGRPADALAALEPLLVVDRDELPGQVLLLAGLAARARGDAGRAEQLLAAVKPADPAFAAARQALGEMSLDAADPRRALRYFESAGDGPRTGAGRWAARRALGENSAADGVLDELRRRDPGGLSLLEVRRLQRLEAEEADAREAAAEPVADAPVARPSPPAGRHTLQFGAWSDRGRALDMVERLRPQVPDVRIDETRDDRGQVLYKVRAGAYANPAEARSEARRLSDRLGVDVFVTLRED